MTYGEHKMVFVDKAGNTKPLTSNKRPHEDFTISPDGKYLAITIEGPSRTPGSMNIARDTETRFNFGIENRDPTWTPDGKRIADSGYKDGKYAVFWKPLEGSAPEEPLLLRDNSVDAWFFSPDGNTPLYADWQFEVGLNIGALSPSRTPIERLTKPTGGQVGWLK